MTTVNPQQTVEQNVRLTLGDMHVQLIIANARIAELEAQIAALEPPEVPAKPNGKAEGKEVRQ